MFVSTRLTYSSNGSIGTLSYFAIVPSLNIKSVYKSPVAFTLTFLSIVFIATIAIVQS